MFFFLRQKYIAFLDWRAVHFDFRTFPYLSSQNVWGYHENDEITEIAAMSKQINQTKKKAGQEMKRNKDDDKRSIKSNFSFIK